MHLKSKSFIALSSAVCLTMALTTGCNTAARNQQSPNQAGGTTQIGQNLGATPGQDNMNMLRGDMTNMLGGNNLRGNNNQGRNTSPGGIYNQGLNYLEDRRNNNGGVQLNQVGTRAGFDPKRADGIRRQLMTMNELQNSSVVINGTTALVGYRASDTAADAGNLRNTITNKIKQMDNTITNVIATDSQNFATEINRLATDLRGNTTDKDIGARFNNLVQSIMPNNNNNNMLNNMNNMAR